MDHAKAMQLARELAGPPFAPGPLANLLEQHMYCSLITKVARMILPVNMQDEFLAHFDFYAGSNTILAREEALCEDEGCPHHGTPHVCRTRLEPGQPDLSGDFHHTGHEL